MNKNMRRLLETSLEVSDGVSTITKKYNNGDSLEVRLNSMLFFGFQYDELYFKETSEREKDTPTGHVILRNDRVELTSNELTEISHYIKRYNVDVNLGRCDTALNLPAFIDKE